MRELGKKQKAILKYMAKHPEPIGHYELEDELKKVFGENKRPFLSVNTPKHRFELALEFGKWKIDNSKVSKNYDEEEGLLRQFCNEKSIHPDLIWKSHKSSFEASIYNSLRALTKRGLIERVEHGWILTKLGKRTLRA